MEDLIPCFQCSLLIIVVVFGALLPFIVHKDAKKITSDNEALLWALGVFFFGILVLPCYIIYRLIKSGNANTKVTNDPSMKICPNCSEPLRPEEIICRYCDYDVLNKIVFNCTKCKSQLAVDEEHRGEKIECPKCRTENVIA
jgi:DNA-directed RNA polymerase subunit RPC12/RpoP